MSINKIIVLIVTILVLSTAVYAGEVSAIGIKGGLVRSNFSGDDVVKGFNSKLGISVGGFVTYNVNQTTSIQTELLYTSKGVNIDIYESMELEGYLYTTNIDATWNLKYVEIPVLLKFNFLKSERININFFVGESLGIKVIAKDKSDYSYTLSDNDGNIIYSESESIEEDIEEISSFEFGAVIGAGLGFGKISIDGRFNLGLISATDLDDSDIRNSVIAFMVGYSF